MLRHLLLSKETRGRDRGFISYAELGINQLGAVYEGLMSYTGFFAETDLYEVAKGGDAVEGLVGGPGRRGPTASPTTDFVTVEDEVTGETQAGPAPARARSSSGSPAASASSPRRTTPPRC